MAGATGKAPSTRALVARHSPRHGDALVLGLKYPRSRSFRGSSARSSATCETGLTASERIECEDDAVCHRVVVGQEPPHEVAGLDPQSMSPNDVAICRDARS